MKSFELFLNVFLFGKLMAGDISVAFNEDVSRYSIKLWEAIPLEEEAIDDRNPQKAFMIAPTEEKRETVKFSDVAKGDYWITVEDPFFSNWDTEYVDVFKIKVSDHDVDVARSIPKLGFDFLIKSKNAGSGKILIKIERFSQEGRDPVYRRWLIVNHSKEKNCFEGELARISEGWLLMSIFRFDSKSGKGEFLGAATFRTKGASEKVLVDLNQ